MKLEMAPNITRVLPLELIEVSDFCTEYVHKHGV